MLCQPAVARAEVLSQRALRPLVPVVLNGGGVDRLICHDLDGDGRADLAYTIFSGGTAGDTSWIVELRTTGGWRVVHVGRGYKVALARRGRDLVETEPVYRANDPNCCPSGGFAHRRWRWTGHVLAVARRWHDRSAGG